MIIAIDGPAAAGKGTIADRLAMHYRLPHLDTGLLYRAIARDMAERGLNVDDPKAAGKAARALNPTMLGDPQLRGRETGELASRVSVHEPVRAALVKFQRDFANRPGGAVLDGRDIGTAICPEAEVKIFVTASPEVRALRRTNELRVKGRDVTFERILGEIRERDARDSSRAVAPLKAAPDAHLLDTTHLTADEAFKAALAIVEAHRKPK
ncbi:MAG: (d)CMP kinase [Bauldia sp.]